MEIDDETKRCLLCMRIPFEMMISASEKMVEDEKIAYENAENAARLIKETYLEKPYILCGRSPRSLVGAALYIVRSDARFTQGIITKTLDITEPTLRNVVRLFPKEIRDRYMKPISSSSVKGKHICLECRKIYDDHKPIIKRLRLSLFKGAVITQGSFCSEECAKTWRMDQERHWESYGHANYERQRRELKDNPLANYERRKKIFEHLINA